VRTGCAISAPQRDELEVLLLAGEALVARQHERLPLRLRVEMVLAQAAAAGALDVVRRGGAVFTRGAPKDRLNVTGMATNRLEHGSPQCLAELPVGSASKQFARPLSTVARVSRTAEHPLSIQPALRLFRIGTPAPAAATGRGARIIFAPPARRLRARHREQREH